MYWGLNIIKNLNNVLGIKYKKKPLNDLCGLQRMKRHL